MSDLPLPARFVGGELLGRGPGTEVYRAHDQLLDRPVAVKLFLPGADPLTTERIDREGQALARLTHPGLIAVYDCGHHELRPYLVMQLVVGHTLQARLIEGPLPVSTVLDLGVQLTDALAHVHARGIVHRDIKPSNIFLDEAGRPFLGDFGIALLVGQARLTSYDEIIGTPAYLAPEQVRGGNVGPAADIYALGLVLIECLTGEVEYGAKVKAEAALARLTRRPRIPADLPAWLADLLRAMTDDQPGRRPTARACAAELSAGDTRSLPLSRTKHRRGLVLAAGVCAAAAAMAGLLAAAHPTAPVSPTGAGTPVVPSIAPAVVEPSSSTTTPPSSSAVEHPSSAATPVVHEDPARQQAAPEKPVAPGKAVLPGKPPGHGKPGSKVPPGQVDNPGQRKH